MPDTYVFTGKDGVSRSFVGDRPPTDDEMKAIESSEAPAKPKESRSDSGALALGAASTSMRPAATALEAFGTSPTAAKTVGSIARVGTTVAGLAHGVSTGNIPEVIASPIAGWHAGKGGYFLGKGMQAVARPVSTALSKSASYATKLNPVIAAQGVNDLAQMAEPGRKDIGVLGITTGDTPDPDHPALLNLLAMKAVDAIKALVAEGLSLGEATRTYWNLKARSK